MTTLAHSHPPKRRDLGAGFYGLGDLRAFVALSGARKDGERVLSWLTLILNPVSHRPRRADYSFSDLVSLFVVRELLRKGVRPMMIRNAERYLCEKWATDRPFVSDEIQTDGRRVFVDDELIAGQIESADLRGQQVMYELVKDRLTYVHYRNGSAAYWTPAKRVLIDPRVQFGEPVLAGTRVPTEAVAAMSHALGRKAAAAQLAISSDAARDAIAFEKRLAAARV